jgi:hypothetical protein
LKLKWEQSEDQSLSQEFINPLKTLLSSFQGEADQLLSKNKIYDILNYGWLDHDTPDPEHFGHFIWQTEPPFEHEWGAFFNQGKVTYTPTKRDEVFLQNGEDFAGSMISQGAHWEWHSATPRRWTQKI